MKKHFIYKLLFICVELTALISSSSCSNNPSPVGGYDLCVGPLGNFYVSLVQSNTGPGLYSLLITPEPGLNEAPMPVSVSLANSSGAVSTLDPVLELTVGTQNFAGNINTGSLQIYDTLIIAPSGYSGMSVFSLPESTGNVCQIP